MKVALLVLLLAGTAHADGRLLALDDVYDCAFAKDGTVLAATGGGLRMGARVLTALDGLPDTRVEGLSLDGDTVLVGTRAGTAHVSVATGRITDVVRMPVPFPLPRSFERFGEGIVRKRARSGERACIATSDGLYVAEGGAPVRVVAPALPTGDVAALAASSRGVFIGTFDRGLFHFDGTSIEHLEDPALSPHINALAFDAERHVLWIATARGLVRCDARARMKCRRIGDHEAKHALLVVKNGRVIAGGDESLLFVAADGSVEGATTRKRGARYRSIWSLAMADDGTLYAGTTGGIYFGSERTFVNAPDRLQRVCMVQGTLPDDWVTALALHGHELLVGTYNAGIVSLRRDGMKTVNADRALGYVNTGGITILQDGTLAIATMDGLHVGTFGDFRTVPTLGRDTTQVLAGTSGEMWVATRRGVERTSVAVAANAHVHE